MYILMKDGKYFTGNITFGELPTGAPPGDGALMFSEESEEEAQEYLDFMIWTRHPGSAKVWEKHRSWAEKAAAKWGGEVVEIQAPSH